MTDNFKLSSKLFTVLIYIRYIGSKNNYELVSETSKISTLKYS